MSTTTPNLGLFKYDPSTDGAQTFNIQKALNENWDKVDAAVKNLSSAAEYSAAQIYALGDYCTHDGKLYRCTTAITEAEAWTEAHWTETSVTAELIAIYTLLQNKVNKAGDEMTGALTVRGMVTIASNSANKNILRLFDYNDTTRVRNLLDESNYAEIVIPQSGDNLRFDEMIGGVYNSRTILHTGNKPSGSYTGNGSEAARTINTGGIGGYCFIGDAYGFGFAIASGNGIACINIYNGNISYIRASDGSYFKDGILHVATSSELLNKSGYVFDYQVL